MTKIELKFYKLNILHIFCPIPQRPLLTLLLFGLNSSE